MYTEPSVLPRTSSQSAFWLGLRLSNYFSRSVPWLSSKLPSPTSSFHPRPRPSQWPLSAAPSPAPFARASSIRPQWPPPRLVLHCRLLVTVGTTRLPDSSVPLISFFGSHCALGPSHPPRLTFIFSTSHLPRRIGSSVHRLLLTFGAQSSRRLVKPMDRLYLLPMAHGPLRHSITSSPPPE